LQEGFRWGSRCGVIILSCARAAARRRSLMEGLFQPMHLFFILLIVLIIFGPGKLPDLGRGLGKGIREFKDALRGGMADAQKPDVRVSMRPARVTVAVNRAPQVSPAVPGALKESVRRTV